MPRRSVDPRIFKVANFLLAILMIGHPAVAIYLMIQTSRTPQLPSLFFLLCFLELMGFVSAIGILLSLGWWPSFAVAFGFLLAFYALFTESAAAIFTNGALGLGIALYVAQNPVVESAYLPRTGGTTSGEMLSNFKDAELDMPEGEKLEALKYKLEAEKFNWQRNVHRAENGIFNRHFGVIITAIISFSAIIVSYLQLSISSHNAKVQIENEKLKNDREFYLQVSRFLLSHEEDLKSENPEKILFLKDVVVSTFPHEIALQIAGSMKDSARTPQARKIWDDASRYLRTRSSSPR